MIRVLFVCLGNICRSPMAEAVFRHMVAEEGLSDLIAVDSAGIGGWHAGERPHRGTIDVLNQHGVAHEGIRARQIRREDLETFDYIVAMDEDNLRGIQRLRTTPKGQVFRLLELVDDMADKNVPDPYHTGNFAEVYELVTEGCKRLLDRIKKECGLSPQNRQ
jgi:protein-tyrosine phosphatase